MPGQAFCNTSEESVEFTAVVVNLWGTDSLLPTPHPSQSEMGKQDTPLKM